MTFNVSQEYAEKGCRVLSQYINCPPNIGKTGICYGPQIKSNKPKMLRLFYIVKIENGRTHYGKSNR